MVAVFPGNCACVKTFNDFLLKHVIAVKNEEGISLDAVAEEAYKTNEEGTSYVYEVTVSCDEVSEKTKHSCVSLIDKMAKNLRLHYIKYCFYEAENFVLKYSEEEP
jgi:hypothetical protein